MLIDWITAKLDEKHLSEETIRILRSRSDRIIRISAETGEQVYETQAWDSIRSDSHSITIRMSSDCLFICGSPARKHSGLLHRRVTLRPSATSQHPGVLGHNGQLGGDHLRRRLELCSRRLSG